MFTRNEMENDFSKQFAGCIGSMINIFDLSPGTARTKMLTQKPHTEDFITCFPVASHQPDLLKKQVGNVANKIDNTQVISDQRIPPSKKLSGTLIKTHIPQEMRKEVKSNQKSPTVVARLMGLDSLPMRQQSRGYSPCLDLKQEVKSYQLTEDNDFVNQTGQCPEQNIEKDVYEVYKNYHINAQSSENGTYDRSSHRTRMALVQQKFIEAKRLATNENFLQSKEFRDAIEVLSSNRDLFLKFLEEPNSHSSKHFSGSHSGPLPSQTKRITVLKPLSANEENFQKGREEQLYQADENVERTRHHRRSTFSETEPLVSLQPTRIVILKPSPADPRDIKKIVTSSTNLSGQLSYGFLRTDDSIESRELAKEITRRMRESLIKNRRDGDLLSSVLSSGYVCDESSFHKTESDYMEEEICSLSNMEIATPTSQHSWDFLKRAGSPQYLSSSDQASRSSESSVVREAKKRLSERLALVVSSVNGQDQRQENRSSSTLREMLAISASMREGIDDSGSRISGEEDHLETPLTPFSNEITKDECSGNNSPIMLSRSISLPDSSSMYGSSTSNVGSPSSFIKGRAIKEEVRQSKTVKSSLKGKFTSLLFSRNKKQNKEKATLDSLEHQLDDRLQHGMANVQGVAKADDLIEHAKIVCFDPNKPAECHQTDFSFTASTYDDSDMVYQKRAIRDLETKISGDLVDSMSRTSGNVLAGHPQALSRSPPIESVARTLSRSNRYLEATTSYTIKSFLSKADEEQAQFAFVGKLISSASMRRDKSGLIFTSWYSLDVPLNPLLLDELVYMKDDDDDDDIKHHEKRSSDRHLLFDCANEALLDLNLRATWALYPWTVRHSSGAVKGGIVGSSLADEVWGIVKSLISRENCSVVQCRNNYSSVADNLVKREITGRQWSLSMWLEMHEISKEIGGELLEDLVEEALSELIT